MKQKLLVATHNQGKVVELANMMAELAIEWLSLDDLGLAITIEETGESFSENAILKATGYAAASGLLTLADDSGLEVDALGGQPGVHTARYGGEGLTAQERYRYLLRAMRDIAWEERAARFRCVIALAGPDGLLGTAEGVCEGMIALEPAGDGGFGYDPVFYLPQTGKTMAQLSPAVKQSLSHRGQAVRAITPLLKSTLEYPDKIAN